MKQLLTIVAGFLFTLHTLYAQEPVANTAPAGRQYMQITTIESVVAGGLGRSKMIITNPDGSQKETNIENLFSLAGINFKNIKENDNNLLNTLRQYTDAGWKLDHTTSLTLSPGEAGGNGIFMTRYLLSMPVEKKQERFQNE